MEKKVLLKVLVGSRAHGLETETSDWDYRSVWVVPTSKLLEVGANPPKHDQGEGDSEGWELGHFLELAMKSSPSILQVFKAPVLECPDLDQTNQLCIPGGAGIRALFPHVWSSVSVYNSFYGFGDGLLIRALPRGKNASLRWKELSICACVFLQGIELLRTGDMHVEIQDIYPFYDDFGYKMDDDHSPIIGFMNNRFQHHIVPRRPYNGFLRAVRGGQFSLGDVVDMILLLRKQFNLAYKENPDKKSDIDAINRYLLTVRRNFW